MTRLEYRVLHSPPMRRARRAAAAVRLRGFGGLSVYEVAHYFLREVRGNALNVRSAAVTYNFLMAIPPTMLVLFSLVPYLPLDGANETLVATVPLIIPDEGVARTVTQVLLDFLNTERGGLLSFGVLLAIFFSSNGMMGLMRSFDRALPVYRKRSGASRRWTALKLTGMLVAVVLLMLAGLILQSQALNGLLFRWFGGAGAVRAFSLVLIAVLLFCAISCIYTYGPSLTQRFRFVSPGSVLATGLCILTTTVFFFLVGRFLHYNQVYGSIGTLIAFMVWVWLNTLVLLVGYELNVSILLGRIAKREGRL